MSFFNSNKMHTFVRKPISPPVKDDVVKKAKIGITIKKSPNSDRTFESRLLDQGSDNDTPAPIKNKHLDIG